MPKKRNIAKVFSLSVAALLLAVLIFQPRSLAQFKMAAEQPLGGTLTEGQGFTTDTNKLNTKQTVDFAEDQSFDKADFETGAVAPEEDSIAAAQADTSTAATTAVVIGPNPTLPGGVDHVASGTGSRNSGYGTIRLRGVPTGSTIVRAWLYWGTVYANPVPTTAKVTFNGTAVGGNRINAPTAEPCWLFQSAGFGAYRANVRPLLVAGANGDYKLTNMPSAITNGTDPFKCAPPFPTPPTPGSEGATLLVIYSHSSIPTSARTYIHQGPTLVTGNTTVSNNLSPVCPTHTIVKQTRFGADGQIGCSVFSIGSLNGEVTLLGPSVPALFQIRGPGSTIDTNSDWNGGDGGPLNQLWDTQTNAFGSVNGVTNLIPNGSAQYFVQYSSIGDCFITVAHVLTVK